jgi:hypothetical protein
MQGKDLNQVAQNSSALPFSISLLEESLRVRLEAFAFEDREMFEYTAQRDLSTLQNQLELQLLQIKYLLNEIDTVHLLKKQPFIHEQK